MLRNKNALYSLMLLALLGGMASCAASRTTAYTPAGEWNYTVRDTPYGNMQGTMIISGQKDSYEGTLRVEGESAPLDNLTIEGDTLNSTSNFDGNSLTVTGVFEGDTFTGEVTAAGSRFPISASRITAGSK